MSEVVPPALISQHHHFLNNKMTDGFSPSKQKPEDSKIQGVVLPWIPKSSPSVLFVSAMSPDVVLNQIPELEIDRQGNKRKRRPWNKKRSES